LRAGIGAAINTVSDHHVFSRDVCTVPKNSRREFSAKANNCPLGLVMP
jgi:hypothetical protein